MYAHAREGCFCRNLSGEEGYFPENCSETDEKHGF